MTDHEFALIQQTKRREIYRNLRRGMQSLKKPVRAGYFAALVAAIATFIYHTAHRPISGIIDTRQIEAFGYAIVGVVAVLAALYLMGYIPHSREMQNNLERAGIVNRIGEAPSIVDVSYPDNRLVRITVELNGYQVADWMEQKSAIESALNLVVLKITDGFKMRQVVILGVHPTGVLPEKHLWNKSLSSPDAHTLVIGKSKVGTFTINLLKTPHWLIAATTGMGKTQLVLLIVEQCIAKGMEVTIADWKGGIDFDQRVKEQCRFITDYDALSTALDDYSHMISTRRQLYNLEIQRHEDENITCNNLETYNKIAKVALEHHVLLIDEASMIFDASGRSKEDKAMIAAIIEKVNEIGRIGRAFGVHLIICTQRPDVNSIPGSIKANLDGRIAGHTADNTSSMVVLDTADAARLPSIPGRFIIRDGGGIEQVFQAYLSA